MEESQGLKTKIAETEVFTGEEIKDLYENPNEATFLGKYFMKQKIILSTNKLYFNLQFKIPYA